MKEQVDLIREAFGYIHRFQGKTFVIKIDYAIIRHPFFPILVKDLVHLKKMGIRIVLIPGAKERIDEILSQYGITWKSEANIRISTPEAIPFIKMAAFDVANKIMTLLAENKINAVIGNWVRARSLGVRDGVDFQSTGTVEKIELNLIDKVLAEGLVPIFPCIGWSSTGNPYNISSNELAAILSRELQAAKLFFITEFGGIFKKEYKIPDNITISEEGLLSRLNLHEAEEFLKLNAGDEQKSGLEAVALALKACRGGVNRAHIVDGRLEGVILEEIFSNLGSGTMIYSNQYENIRPMESGDTPQVLRLMQPFVEKGLLLPRSEQDMLADCGDYVLYEVDGTIHCCGALHIYAQGLGEIARIAADKKYAHMGIGNKIVAFLLEKARRLSLTRIFVLTTQASDWFLQLGFEQGEVKDLPEKKRELYDRSRNSRILIYNFPE